MTQPSSRDSLNKVIQEWAVNGITKGGFDMDTLEDAVCPEVESLIKKAELEARIDELNKLLPNGVFDITDIGWKIHNRKEKLEQELKELNNE